MKVTILPSAVSGGDDGQAHFCTSYLINDTVAVDAGSLGFYRSPQEQAKVRHVVVSHTHIDHTGSIPIFVENAYEGKRDCVTIHGSQIVLDSLQRDYFNDRLWPDFIKLSAATPDAPFLKLSPLEAGKALEVEGVKITPVEVNHVVPTFGFVVEDSTAAVVFTSDTGPTEEIWNRANRTPNLKAVFIEATFPNNLQWLADVSKHLTPAQFQKEIEKLKSPVALIAVHLKARFRKAVAQELQALGLPNFEIGQMGKEYSF